MCMCIDAGCKAHTGVASCKRPAGVVLFRVDMDDQTGTDFCEECAADALESGVFTTADEDESDDDNGDDDDEPTEPQDGDITTTDHQTFYQYGSPCLRLVNSSTGEYWEARAGHGMAGATWKPLGRFASVEQALKAYMTQEQFWPNCWFVSDHGNAHLMDLTEDKR